MEQNLMGAIPVCYSASMSIRTWPDLVDAGVLVAPVLAVKPIVAGIVVRHASAGSLLYGKIPSLKEHDDV